MFINVYNYFCYLFLLLFKLTLIEKADIIKYLNKQFGIGENINM